MKDEKNNIIKEIKIYELPQLPSLSNDTEYSLSIKYSNDHCFGQIHVYHSRELAELIRILLLKYGKNINIKQDKK